MPIHCDISFRTPSEEAFLKLDYQTRGFAFGVQNDLGRLCEESIYQTDLAARLEDACLGPVLSEVPVRVSHDGFSKTYYLDCVVQDAVIYELKAVTDLGRDHQQQLLTYLFLTNQPRGVLLNFRAASLQHRFVSTRLTHEKRRSFTISDARWRNVSVACAPVRDRMLALLKDWGAFLEIAIYQEALAHFMGGEAAVYQAVQVHRCGRLLGNQRMFLLAPDVALKLSAITTGLDKQEEHLRRLLLHTRLKTIQWINLNHDKLEFTTVTTK